jgi:hypothetical protein
MPVKKTFFAAALTAALIISYSTGAIAQRGVMATVLGGYQWGGTLQGYEGEAKLNDAGSWGIALDIPVAYETYVELIYTRQVTDLSYRTYGVGGTTGELFDLAVEYYQVGGLYTVSKEGPRPFGTMSLGATRFAPQEPQLNSEWKFSFALGLGILVDIGERLGIRMHARLLMPMMSAGGGLWCGTGGCSIGIGGGSTLLQGDIAAGLVIKL